MDVLFPPFCAEAVANLSLPETGKCSSNGAWLRTLSRRFRERKHGRRSVRGFLRYNFPQAHYEMAASVATPGRYGWFCSMQSFGAGSGKCVHEREKCRWRSIGKRFQGCPVLWSQKLRVASWTVLTSATGTNPNSQWKLSIRTPSSTEMWTPSSFTVGKVLCEAVVLGFVESCHS